jgi:hypothetical protein
MDMDMSINAKDIKMLHKNLLLCSVLIFTCASSYAAVDFDYSGSVRLRYESINDYNFASAKQDYMLSQLRLGLKAKVNDNSQFFIELQDSRIFGEEITDIPGINEDARNQPFADNLDLHQLHWTYKADNYSVKIGRQKFNLGDMRLVASLEWVNTARVHDGIRFSYQATKGTKIDVFSSQLVSVDPSEFNDQSDSNNRYFDSGFHGIYYSDKNLLSAGTVDLWWFLRENSNIDDEIHTFGGKYALTVGKVSYDLQGSFQKGDFSGMDHSAHYLHAGLNYKLDKGKIGVAYNLSSGDSDLTDNDHKTFDNLYPLNHAYYGFMDMVSLQNIHNLEAVYQRSGFRLGLQAFWLNETNDKWYNAGLKGNTPRQQAALSNNNTDSYIGSEIDVTYKKAFINKSLVVIGGASIFFTGDYIDDTGTRSENATFFFMQTKYSF